MERKYYFRGLGLGIIVTAVIMGIALSGGGKKREMTDEEVIARAKELGMVEDSRLVEPSEENGEEEGTETKAKAETPVKMDIAVAADKEAADKKAAEENQKSEEKQNAEEKQEKAKEQETAGQKPVVGTPEPVADASKKSETGASVSEKPKTGTNEMTKQDEDVPKPETDGGKSVTIASGDGSYTVARKLAEAGIVNSADSYDDFLCANGYDKKLRPGTFQIPAGASEEQIARIVTGQE